MAFNQSQLDQLEAAIATGVLTVSYSGPPARSITYQSLAEMRALRAEMVREIGGAPTYRLGATRKGLGA